MAFGKKERTVAGIIAPVSKIVKELEDHCAAKTVEAEAHQKAAEESLRKKDSCVAEHSQSAAIAENLKNFFQI
jgi:hypothetical protein